MLQAVILAAGKSTRTYPLTLTRPKPLLKIMNKPILAHLFDQMIECGVEETIVIVGYRKEMITEYFGDEYGGMRIVYHEQKEQLGTLHALHQVRHLLKDRFYVLYGDDLLHADDLKKCLDCQYAISLMRTNTPERFGIAVIEDGKVVNIVEKPAEYIGDLASVGGFMFDMKIFDYPLEKDEGEKEFYIPNMLRKLAKDATITPIMIERYWLPTGYCWDLLNANEVMMKGLEESDINGEVEEGVTIKGNAVIGEGTVVKAGSYLEGNVVIGDNCVIGPNAYLQDGTVIGNNCKVGHHVSVKNSIFMDGARAGHLTYVGDSILGENVNLGAGTITANLRHDSKNVFSMHDGKLIDTGRRKFGVVLADGVKTGIKTMFYPGRKMWPGTMTFPGESVSKDVMD
ncbi:MAG: bifunctional sugar-1-phosphate nucleotidylyltransferase/acetyltransferase [Candidatus Woesearchaeota archaeon]